MRILLPFTISLIGCTTDETAKTSSDTSSVVQDDTSQQDTTIPTEEQIPSGTNGTEPASEIGPPTFTATNYDYASRSQQDLLGQPTVIWFFPFSATPG